MQIIFQNCMLSLENSVDPDQLASDEASWSGTTLFSFKWWLHINNEISFLGWLEISSYNIDTKHMTIISLSYINSH